MFVVDLYEGTASQGGRGTPDFGDFNSLVQGVDFNSYVNEAYVEFPISRLRFLFGHTWLRWGPGESGTLALSDAAPALDMLRVELGMFRRFRYNQFVAMLDPGAETYLAGHRLEWQACRALNVGVTEAARFDGTSQAPLYMIPVCALFVLGEAAEERGLPARRFDRRAVHQEQRDVGDRRVLGLRGPAGASGASS